jgi:haloalkane dehalogenase
LREAFRAYRSSQGEELIVNQNKFMGQTFALAGRPLSAEEIAQYSEPFSVPGSRSVILDWVRQLPIGGDPAAVTQAVAAYSEYLRTSKTPKLLLHTSPGAVLLAEHVDWCRQNCPQIEIVNLDPSSSGVPIHLLQEKYPRAMSQAIANWYQRMRPASPQK